MYAGFWKRLAAWFIDYVLISLVIYALAFIIGITTGIGTTPGGTGQNELAGYFFMFGGFFIMMMLVLPWLYYSLLESSAKQATLGKMALGIKVTGNNGRRISFGRAAGRNFAKILSGLIILIGFIMAGFTARKQALHDIIAGTLVVKSRV